MATLGLVGIGVPPAAADVIEANLEVVGRFELDSPGRYGDVAVIGRTAIVAVEAAAAPGSPCPSASVAVVDIRKAQSPRLVASIPVPPGMTVADIDAATVSTESFTGDLVALALGPMPGAPASCGDGSLAGVVYHDVTDPAQPRLLGQSAGCRGCTPGPRSVSIAQRADGRVLAARVDLGSAGVAFDDVGAPAHPVTVAQWSAPATTGVCGTGDIALRAVLHDEGKAAVVAYADGRIFDLDVADPARPASAGEAPPPADGPRPPTGPYVAVLPLGNRTIAVVAEEEVDAPCGAAEPPAHGLRVLALTPGGTPVEAGPVRYPGGGSPGRLVASGSLAYVAWHGDGVRVIDFGEVRARTVARFRPVPADVIGVALLPEHVVVTDASLGLYVLERPDEGGGRAGFWSQFLSLLPYLGGAMVMAAMFAVPRLAMRGVRVGAGAPAPSRVPGRPA